MPLCCSVGDAVLLTWERESDPDTEPVTPAFILAFVEVGDVMPHDADGVPSCWFAHHGGFL
jgi:hypothetical protein